MSILRSKVEEQISRNTEYLVAIEFIWTLFYCNILPTLECMLYLIEV